MSACVKVLSIMESRAVSGPAKNLIRFAKLSRPIVDLQVLTYTRDSDAQQLTPFQLALRDAEIPLRLIQERKRFDPSVLKHLKEAILDQKPDIVQTHAPKSHFLYSLVRKQLKLPWLAFHHGYTAEDFKMRAYNALNRISLRRADKVITVCTAFKEELLGEGVPERKICVLHNSIEENWFSAAPVRSERKDNSFTFLCIGRLSTEKGHRYLLQALQLLSSRAQRPFRLNLVGAGPLREELEGLAQSLNLGSHISFIPAQEDVRTLFASADSFVLPSLSEGSPNVLLEAMAAGAPMVATSVGGVPELVGNTALLVPPSDPEALCNAMLKLMDDGEMRSRLAREAAARVRMSFHPRAYASKLIQIYQGIVGFELESHDESTLVAAHPGR